VKDRPLKKPAKDRRVTLEFDDNALAALLYGDHDRNLARVERELGVLIGNKGNVLTVSGPEADVETARQVFASLWSQLKRDGVITAADVEDALRFAGSDEDGEAAPQIHTLKIKRRAVKARGPVQAAYVRAMAENELVIGIGPAGTGKTYLAAAQAVSMLLSGAVDRIVLTRPAVEAGERLGFLPGDLREKIDPYLRPLFDALNDLLPPEQVVKRLSIGEIEVAPLAFMRGRTLNNAFIILDEAQNTTEMQMKMALTRLGQNSRMVVTGDLSQIDLPGGTRSGLRDAVEICGGLDGVAVVRFSEADVVRHPLVGRIVRAYDARDAARAARPPRGE
jgi:phosphate starvation-inducible PhoH-like protein